MSGVGAGVGTSVPVVSASVADTSGVGMTAAFTGVWFPEGVGSAFWQPPRISRPPQAIEGMIFILVRSLASRPPGGEQNAPEKRVASGFIPLDRDFFLVILRSMKTLLAILLSFIVTEAPVLAIHGGYSLGGSAGQVVGTYAGVLIPTANTPLNGTTTANSFGSNAIGLFTLNVETAGIGNGTLYLFSGGEDLTGTIMALPDPSNINGIVGVLSATGEVAVAAFNDAGELGLFGFNETEEQVTGQASGGFSATTAISLDTQSATGVNLDGTANVTVQTMVTGTDGNTSLTPTDSIVFAVDGFQQSATPDVAASTAVAAAQ